MNHRGLQLVVRPAAEPVTVADAKAHSRISQNVEDSEVLGYITAARQVCEGIVRRALMPQTWRLALENWPGRDYVNGVRSFSNLGEYYRWNHIELPHPPLVSITTFTYTDTAGNVSNMVQGYGSAAGNYLLDTDSEPGRIVLPYSGLWPTTVLLPAQPIKITYACGYSSFAGVVQVDASGIATWQSGDKFDPGLAGTWINIGGVSLAVVSVTDDTHLQLAASVNPTATSLAYTANLVPMAIRQAILLLVCHYFDNRAAVVVGRGVTSTQVEFTVDDLLAQFRVWGELAA